MTLRKGDAGSVMYTVDIMGSRTEVGARNSMKTSRKNLASSKNYIERHLLRQVPIIKLLLTYMLGEENQNFWGGEL